MKTRVLIIDGHSVIFAWQWLRQMHSSNATAAREALIRELTSYQDWSGQKVVLVFDGKGCKTSCEKDGIQVYYSACNKTADDVIERLVAKYVDDYEITVVTCDGMESQTVSAMGALCVSAQQLEDDLVHVSRQLRHYLENRRKKLG